MKKILTSLFQSLFATLVLLLVLEGISRLAGIPAGGSTFSESLIIRNKLSTHKPAGEFRIFTYGESSMHGSHYWPASNPARWIESYLKDFLPGKNIRVVNFARMGQGGMKAYECFRDTAAYKPDLAIFYMGHNFMLPGNRKDQVLGKMKKSSYFWRNLLRQSHFLSWVYRTAITPRTLSEKVNLLNDSIEYKVIESPPSGLGPENAFTNDSPQYLENLAFFKENVRGILEIARKKKIQALFCKPAGNLKDFPPYMSKHMANLSEEGDAKWQDFYEKGLTAEAGGLLKEAAGFYAEAYKIDPTYADLDFRYAALLLKQGELETAKKLFVQARDYDLVKVRATSDIEQFFEELKLQEVPVVDTEKAIVSEAAGGILGEPVIEDNVHMSVKGHSLLGRAVADEIAQRGWIAPRSEWQFANERPFETVSKELGVNDDLIFSADLKMVHYFGSRFENRLRFAEKALLLRPEDPKALRHLAWSYWLKGDQEKSLEVYSRLEKINPAALAEVFEARPEIKKAFTEKSQQAAAVKV